MAPHQDLLRAVLAPLQQPSGAGEWGRTQQCQGQQNASQGTQTGQKQPPKTTSLTAA